MKQRSRIEEHLHRLRTQVPIVEAVYYAITLLATNEGEIQRFYQSTFSGWADHTKNREVREISRVDPDLMLQNLKEIGEPGVLVNSSEDLFLYLIIGGHGVIEKSLCDQHFPDLTKPKETVRSVSKGFVQAESAPKEWFRRAPTRKERIRILKRDKLRCRICGRSPNDYVDVELHLHHVVPWSIGGLTEDTNLITVCGTCHDGIEPHFDPSLFFMLGIDTLLPEVRDSEDYKRGIMNYRRISTNAYKEMFLGSKKAKG